MAIRVTGIANFRTPFSVELNISQQQFDGLAEEDRTNLIEERVDWMDAGRNAELRDMDIDEVEETP